MAAAAQALDERRRYQREVEELLEQIHVGVDRLQRMMAVGVRSGALEEQRWQLRQRRATLAALVGGEERRDAA
jgi:hypothetical protein